MRPFLFALVALPLLAAGCQGTTIVETPSAAVPATQQAAPTQNTAVQPMSTDDAVQAIMKQSVDEQTQTASDDSDLTTSDADALNGLTNVTNEN